MKARDRAHFAALRAWAHRAAEHVEPDARYGADSRIRQSATQWCLVKIRWASLGLTSEGRRLIPAPLRASLIEVRTAIRDYRKVDSERVDLLARSAPTNIGLPVERLLAENPE